LSNLTADMATAASHAEDLITIGGRSVSHENAIDVLGERLESLPQNVRDTRRFTLGVFRGLTFGLILHPHFVPEAYLEGVTTYQSGLSREHHGPRAILNALSRTVDTYGVSCTSVRQELTIAESQLRDYQARLGQPFQHDSYMSTLTALRDQLKMALSGGTSEPADQPLPNVSELAEQIKALKAKHTIEGTPQRVGNRRRSAEQPVTARIRRRAEPI
jgi:hypothetical protein